ncbi:ATP-binding protein [Lacisediminihabitans changchengi]|uniref:PspC domain-containing protein n=1 Tax=Lacisediminihabitans changchengi TaxID=2787634 RepID=A0A934W3K6_9MICO|nr:ATP-binding protein [Lacisediminihabitans changchengi]MBK4349083.1 PspC domain-containing protein [Lacisediminihabitans changchengi]
MTTRTERRMTRPHRVVLSGVSAALADHLAVRVGWVRFVFIVLTVLSGSGALLYLWLWALAPVRQDGTDHMQRRVPVTAFALALTVVSALFTAGNIGRGLNPFILSTLAFGVFTVVWALVVDVRDERRSPRRAAVLGWIAEGVLVLAGLAVLVRANARVVDSIGAVVLIVVAIGTFIVPFAVHAWTERMGARAAQVREVQRAEIAAHLHDSVLQTLALIQNRAGASSEVARLARAQERELRDWLFAGTTPAGSDLASELRDIAAAIELDYPARVEIVVVGEPPAVANAAVLAASREAMVNAARHVGGEISVYLEASPAAVDVFVRDRGPGVDLASLPDDRLGIRESIIGRMTRAGGTATVRPGAGGIGTEVHLHLEATVSGGTT